MKHRIILTSVIASLGPDRDGLQDVTIYLAGVRLIFAVPAVEGALGNVRLILEYEGKLDAKT
jgi:hypothetical protein